MTGLDRCTVGVADVVFGGRGHASSCPLRVDHMVGLVGTVLVVSAATADASLPKADLTVMQRANATTAVPGQLVAFTSQAVNLGPADSQLDDTISWSRGLHVTRQTCQFVSPDTPSCEFGVIAPNTPARMVVRARITGAVGTFAALTVCAANEGGQTDPNEVNNCSTTLVKIVNPA